MALLNTLTFFLENCIIRQYNAKLISKSMVFVINKILNTH